MTFVVLLILIIFYLVLWALLHFSHQSNPPSNKVCWIDRTISLLKKTVSPIFLTWISSGTISTWDTKSLQFTINRLMKKDTNFPNTHRIKKWGGPKIVWCSTDKISQWVFMKVQKPQTIFLIILLPTNRSRTPIKFREWVSEGNRFTSQTSQNSN